MKETVTRNQTKGSNTPKVRNQTWKENAITYAIVIAAYIIIQIMLKGGHVSSLMKGLLVPVCIYVIMAVSLNLVVGISG